MGEEAETGRLDNSTTELEGETELHALFQDGVRFFSSSPSTHSSLFLTHVVMVTQVCSGLCLLSSLTLLYETSRIQGYYGLRWYFSPVLANWGALYILSYYFQEGPLRSPSYTRKLMCVCSLTQMVLYAISGFPLSNYGYSLWSLLVKICWDIPKYASLVLCGMVWLTELYAKDQELLQLELRSQVQAQSTQFCSLTSKRLQLGVGHIQLLADELHSTANVVFRALSTFSLLSDEDSVGTSPFGMVLTSCFTHIFKICERLSIVERYLNHQELVSSGTRSSGANKFDLSMLLQRMGDLVGEVAARDHIDLVINDADFAFRKVFAYGEGIELHHLMHQVVRFALLNSLPNSTVELGVKIPSPAQALTDPIYENSMRYPFVFQVTFTTSSNESDLDLHSFRPLELVRRQIDATLTHVGGSNRKTIYVHCHLTLPPEASHQLHQPFDTVLQGHKDISTIHRHSLVLVSPSQSRLGSYLQSCWQLMGINLKTCSTDPNILARFLRSINEKPSQSKPICIAINGHFASFQTIVHDLLLRSSGDTSRRGSIISSISIIYLLSPSEYPRATHFLESILSQCHSSFYPSISLVLKPIGFRRFASLFLLHVSSSPSRNHQSTRSMTTGHLLDSGNYLTPPTLITNSSDSGLSLGNNHRGRPPSPTVTKTHHLHNGGIKIRKELVDSSPSTGSGATSSTMPSAAEAVTAAAVAAVKELHEPSKEKLNHLHHQESGSNSSLQPNSQQGGLTGNQTHTSKPAIPFTPLAKLLSKTKSGRQGGKHSTKAAAGTGNNAKTTPKGTERNKARSGSLSASSQSSNRRPGNNSSSYFPQVQSLPINVLIVEDNPINQKILATFLAKRKIKYSVANDGQEAVEKWKEGGFHIVLMDIQLPVMDGIEATKEIRRIERHRQIGFFSPPTTTPQSDPMPVAPSISQPSTPSPRTPPTPIQSPVIIVALTASSLRTDRIEALAAGCNDFLTKPVSLIWLEKKIMEWGCMQALIDVDGWRRLKYSKNLATSARSGPNSLTTSNPNTSLGPATAPVTNHHLMTSSLAVSKLVDQNTSTFNMRSEAMLSKLKRAEEKKRASSPSSSS